MFRGFCLVRLTIIEPHRDDFLLSAYNAVKVIRHLYTDVFLVTVTDSPSSATFSPLIRQMGINHIALELSILTPTIRTDVPPLSELSPHQVIQALCQHPDYQARRDLLHKQLLEIIDPEDEVLTTLGIKHPDHLSVRQAVQGLSVAGLYYVAEHPYLERAGGHEWLEYWDLPRHIYYPEGMAWGHKVELMELAFPGELLRLGIHTPFPEVVCGGDLSRFTGGS